MFTFTKRNLIEIPLGFSKTSKYQSLPREASRPLWRNWRRDKSRGILVLGTGATSITTYLTFNYLLPSRQETPARPSSAWNSEPSEVKKGQAEPWGTVGEMEATGWIRTKSFCNPNSCRLPESSGPTRYTAQALFKGTWGFVQKLCLPCTISFWVIEVLAAIYCQLILKKN